MKFKLLALSCLLIGLNVHATETDQWWKSIKNKDGKIFIDKTKKVISAPVVVQATAAYYKKQRNYYLSSGTYTLPVGVTGKAKILLVGGGGGGGALAGYSGSNCTYGGGGGGGEVLTTSVDLTNLTNIVITIGAGGTGGITGIGDCAGIGGDGGDTTITFNYSSGPAVVYTAKGGGGGTGGAGCTTANNERYLGAGGGISEVAGVRSSDFQSQSKGSGGGAANNYGIVAGPTCATAGQSNGPVGYTLNIPRFNFAIGKGATFGGVGITTLSGNYGISGNGGGGYGGTDAGYTMIHNSWDCSKTGTLKNCKPSLLAGSGGQGYWGLGGSGGTGGYQLPDLVGSPSSQAAQGSGYGAGGAGGYGGGGGGGFVGDGNLPEVGGAVASGYNNALAGTAGLAIIEYTTP